jgi:hypothetical protein
MPDPAQRRAPERGPGDEPGAAELFDPSAFAVRLAKARARRAQALAARDRAAAAPIPPPARRWPARVLAGLAGLAAGAAIAGVGIGLPLLLPAPPEPPTPLVQTALLAPPPAQGPAARLPLATSAAPHLPSPPPLAIAAADPVPAWALAPDGPSLETAVAPAAPARPTPLLAAQLPQASTRSVTWLRAAPPVGAAPAPEAVLAVAALRTVAGWPLPLRPHPRPASPPQRVVRSGGPDIVLPAAWTVEAAAIPVRAHRTTAPSATGGSYPATTVSKPVTVHLPNVPSDAPPAVSTRNDPEPAAQAPPRGKRSHRQARQRDERPADGESRWRPVVRTESRRCEASGPDPGADERQRRHEGPGGARPRPEGNRRRLEAPGGTGSRSQGDRRRR